MPAKVISASDFTQEVDTSVVQTGGLDSIAFQDCANIVRAFEKGAHNSSSEEALFAPLARAIQNLKYWSKASQSSLNSWSINTDKDTSATTGIQFDGTFAAMKDKNFGEALKKAVEDCVPCADRINLLLQFNPSLDFLSIFEEDIKKKIKMLTDLDSLLGNVDTYGDICTMLGFLNFMCVPDLQRMIAVLMALLLQFNFNLSSLFSLIASLVVPLFAPILSGITNLMNQLAALVMSPMTCVLDELRRQLNKIPGTEVATNKLAAGEQLLKSGLGLMEEQLTAGMATVSSKLQFYMDQLKKMLGDWNGDSSTYITVAAQKLQIIRTIGLITSIIKLKRKGADLCKPGATPSASELDNFFKNFLNPNASFKLAVDQDGKIHIEEPDPPLYTLEEPNNGAKIISYEPDNLLQKPVSVKFSCPALRADPEDVDKINTYIKDINRLSEI